jgi:hypothetical protein
MTQSKLMLTCAVAALMFGFTGAVVAAKEKARTLPNIVIATDDTAPDDYATDAGSAKMGEGKGTQSGDQGATEENDTQKIDQPDRRNPATDSDDQGDQAAPSDDEAAPSDEGEDTDK